MVCKKALFALFAGLVCLLHAGISVKADDVIKNSDDFEVDVQLLSSEQDAYNICVDVENKGKDWEGTVRLYLLEKNYIPTAFDTAISLPQDSSKQFVVRIPKGVSDSLDGGVRIVLLNKKDKPEFAKTYKKLLVDEMESIAMGILSDDYASLTYLDMGGVELYYFSTNLPVKLVELNQDNLMDSLSALTILVIDKYNTSVLTDVQRQALAEWIDNGGLLMVGTGQYAQDTLSGLGDVIPDVECLAVLTTDEAQKMAGYYSDRALDLKQLDIAQLQAGTNQYSESYINYGLNASCGNGAVSVVPYSFVDLAKADESVFYQGPRENYIRNVLDEACGNTNSRYQKNKGMAGLYERMSTLRRMLGLLGNSNMALNFGVLKFIIIAYVVLVGPVLYLVLRVAKKREMYWVCVPVSALLGILIIFLAGRGFEVVDTRVYSVTTQDVSGNKGATSYLYCYDAAHREWDLKLKDNYKVAGPMLNENYNYSDGGDLQYYHHIQNEGEELFFGIEPTASFEDCFFYAQKESADLGNISVSCTGASWSGLDGTVTNSTTQDWLYFAVIADERLYIYKELAAGESVSLQDKKVLFTSTQGYDLTDEYVHSYVQILNRKKKKEEDIPALAALGVGITESFHLGNYDSVIVCGVCENWEKTVDDRCKEVSYGCLYTVQ